MSEKRARIAALNDELRRTFQDGRVLQTRGILALGPELVAEVHERVRTFDAFTRENDPYVSGCRTLLGSGALGDRGVRLALR